MDVAGFLLNSSTLSWILSLILCLDSGSFLSTYKVFKKSPKFEIIGVFPTSLLATKDRSSKWLPV